MSSKCLETLGLFLSAGDNVVDAFHCGQILMDYEPLTLHSYVKPPSMFQSSYKVLRSLPPRSHSPVGKINRTACAVIVCQGAQGGPKLKERSREAPWG